MGGVVADCFAFEPDAGPAAGKSIKPYLEGWVRDYYLELGWDRKTGVPTRATKKIRPGRVYAFDKVVSSRYPYAEAAPFSQGSVPLRPAGRLFPNIKGDNS